MTTAMPPIRSGAALALGVLALGQASTGYAQATTLSDSVDATSVRVILVGDSTMATRTGYGDALCARFQPAVECVNLARGGRSSRSFRAEGLWDSVQTLLKDRSITTYVFIQFGHNDQPGKAERSTDLATEFPPNLMRYVAETRAAGARPVLVTPLTRRSFKDGVLQNDLRPWADAILRVARDTGTPVIDLNALSFATVAAVGSREADTLAEESPPQAPLPPGVKSRFDYTHLGATGASLFATMMAAAISVEVSALARHLR